MKIKQLNEASFLLQRVNRTDRTKLAYATKKFDKNFASAIKEQREKILSLQKEEGEKLEDFKIDRASVDEKKNLIIKTRTIVQNGQPQEITEYDYTPEKYKEVLKAVNESNKRIQEANKAASDEDVVFEPYLVDVSLPDYEEVHVLFDEFEIEELTGIIFK